MEPRKFHSIRTVIHVLAKLPLLGRQAILPAVILLSVQVHAQYSDGGVWAKFGMEKKFKGPWEIKLGTQARTAQYSTVLNDLIVDLEGGYKISDLLSASFTFRQGWRRELDGTLLPRQRVSLDLQAKHDMGEFGVSLRSRYQLGLQFAQTEAPGPMDDAVRFRLKVDRKLMKKTQGTASIECFTSAEYGEYLLTDMRYQLEVTRKLKKRHYLSLGYQYQKERQTDDPLSEHVLLLSFDLEIK